jgi:hypothetical protein
MTAASKRIARGLIALSSLGTWRPPESVGFKSNLSSGILFVPETVLEAWWWREQNPRVRCVPRIRL